MNMNSRLLITYFNPKVDRQYLYSAPASGGESVAILSISGHDFRVSDSAKGLVCFYDDDVVCVCNPSTSQILKLPPTTLPRYEATHFRYKVGCAMGYDASAGVQKVVRACTFTARVPHQNDVEEGQLLEVLTLGEGAWRIIPLSEEVRLMADQHGEPRGCVLNGAVHYKGLRGNKKNSEEEEDHVIVALDLEDEKWRVFGVRNPISIGALLVEMDGELGVVGEYDEFGLLLVRIYEEDGEVKEIRVVKKKPWFDGRRSCRLADWGSMQEDGSCTAAVSLADGREVVLTGQLNGLHKLGTFLEYGVETN